jgi:hypothetical protein
MTAGRGLGAGSFVLKKDAQSFFFSAVPGSLASLLFRRLFGPWPGAAPVSA